VSRIDNGSRPAIFDNHIASILPRGKGINPASSVPDRGNRALLELKRSRH
jgi:hypothetical protein